MLVFDALHGCGFEPSLEGGGKSSSIFFRFFLCKVSAYIPQPSVAVYERKFRVFDAAMTTTICHFAHFVLNTL